MIGEYQLLKNSIPLFIAQTAIKLNIKKMVLDSKGGCSKGGKKNYQRPTINQILFPNTSSNYFWSASPHARDVGD